jgi:PBSX family phage terminase large subunit
MTASALEHRYRPRGGCKALFEDRRAEVLLSGPAGTGKSRACLEKLNMFMLLNPGARGLIVRKTQVSLSSSALVTWRTFVVAEALANGTVTYYGGSAEEPPQYRYSNGSRVMIGGLDKASKVMSTEYDVIYVQEAIELTETDWESLTTRLRWGKISFQQLIADTNPDTPTHWLKQRVDRGQTVLHESRHEDNPVYFDDDGTMTPAGRDYIEGKLDRLTGVRYHRLRVGLWVAAEGVIYEGWDPALHLIDPFPIPDEWTRWWAVDFGYRNPFVCQWWAEDPDGRLYLYREIYRTGRIVEDHAKAILAAVRDRETGEWLERKPRAIICDHDSEDRATLERHLGLSTAKATKTVKDGLEAVMARMEPAGDGRPRLFIVRDAVLERDPELVEAKKPASTVEEIPGYVWAPSLDGKPQKEEPLKVDDHGCDAMRYVVAKLDLGTRPRVRLM